MAISFNQEEKIKEKKGISIPFWAVLLIIFLVIVGAAVYFVFFQKVSESEISSQTSGLTQKDLTKIEEILNKLDEPIFKELTPSLPSFSLETPTVPSEKAGRQNPFAPVQ